jgi:hypothetical protein
MDASMPSLVVATLAGHAVSQQVFAVTPEIAHVEGVIVVLRFRGSEGELQLMMQGERLLALGVDRAATWVLKDGPRVKLRNLSKGLRVSVRYAIRRGRERAESVTIMDQVIQPHTECSPPLSVIRRVFACMTRDVRWSGWLRHARWIAADGWAVTREWI